MDLKDIFQYCAELIEEKDNRSPLDVWTNSDFIDLSDRIFDSTKIRLSEKTLKRFFGKEKLSKEELAFYNPQKKTKQAISQYLSFSSWEELLESKYGSKKQRETIKSRVNKKMIITIGVMILFLVVTCIYFLIQESLNIQDDLKFSVNISSAKEATELQLNYKLNISDSFIFNSGDRYSLYTNYPKKRVLKKDLEKMNYTYVVPDLYRPSIHFKNQKIPLDPVILKSNAWEANVVHINMYNESIYQMISSMDSTDGIFSIDSIGLKKEMHSEFVPFYYEYRLVRDFGLMGDSMNLNLDVRNESSIGGLLHHDVMFFLRCEHGDLEVKLMGENASQWAHFNVAEVKLSGMTSNLEKLALISPGWHNIRIVTKAKNAILLFDDLEVYNVNYKNDLGRLYSLIISFKGNGQFKNISLE